MRSGNCALVVFARRPRAGRVKSRLARDLGARRAARVYARLLERTLRAAERTALAPRLLMPADRRDLDWFRRRYARRGWRVRAQNGGDLGRRMQVALAEALERHGAAVLIGTDVADADAADLEAAAAALAAGADAVLGPVADGGYWLLGLTREVPGLFTRLRWGASGVAAETRRRLRRAGAACVELPRRHDVDVARDLRRR